jgi:hypothetical protein
VMATCSSCNRIASVMLSTLSCGPRIGARTRQEWEWRPPGGRVSLRRRLSSPHRRHTGLPRLRCSSARLNMGPYMGSHRCRHDHHAGERTGAPPNAITGDDGT